MTHQRYTGDAIFWNITATYKDDLCIAVRLRQLEYSAEELDHTYSMHILKILCVTALLAVVANAAPAFDFGADVLEGINDDVQREWAHSLRSKNS